MKAEVKNHKPHWLTMTFVLALSQAIFAGPTIRQSGIAGTYNRHTTVSGGDGGGGCTPSYTNTGGTGDRRSLITITISLTPNEIVEGTPEDFVDGNTTGTGRLFWRGVALDSTRWVQFDFGSGNQVLITEAKYYQQDATAQGTWQWQGSNDGSAWSNIGSSFALGGVATQTITALSGNTTKYRYYRIVGVSGTTSNGPWVFQMEFKLCGI